MGAAQPGGPAPKKLWPCTLLFHKPWVWMPTAGSTCLTARGCSNFLVPLHPCSCLAQGDLLKQVSAFLTEQYGIPPALMELKQKGK